MKSSFISVAWRSTPRLSTAQRPLAGLVEGRLNGSFGVANGQKPTKPISRGKNFVSLSDGLVKLTRILADWVEPAPGYDIYLFGSRVRGDHGPNSDVDVVIPDPQSLSEADLKWWCDINEDEFGSINTALPGPLHILPNFDPIADKVRNAREIYRDRQVRCVWMDPKPSNTARAERFGRY